MELSKNYLPHATEEKWYKHWLGKGYFNSTPDNRPPYTVVIPPPNVTGVLHMGHTLNETVQDILVRKARMSGYNACWVPGSDHASIATEARVVNMLKEKGIDKAALTREEFLQYAYEWKEKYGGIIYNQIERLGCSVDWNRVTFTMDDHYYKAVIKVFADLYNKGLIYRGARMIHWDPAAKTALSDEEVEYRDVQGELYYLKYLLDDGSPPQAAEEGAAWIPTADQTLENDSMMLSAGIMKDDSAWLTDEQLNPVQGAASALPAAAPARQQNYIVIATQRPETIMGDTAICVNPHDQRYAHLRGAYAYVPLINRRIPLIFDEYVDKEFGTGALKVTPAHDINDYNLGLKFNLDVINTLNEDGTMSEAAQLYVGEDRFVARKKIVQALKENNNLLKEESYGTRLGYSQRTGVVVEPRISTQWFVKMKEMAAPALEAVTSGRVKIHPGEKFLATYKYWMENVKDWCISRQLWWGQQIPAWYDNKGNMVVAETAQEAQAAYTEKYGQPAVPLAQDEDVLDTWFSSWLWPMEVFHGISRPGNPDLEYYYPTSVLVTGQDIIFFWVARMIMAGMEYKKKIPFSDVYFTGMVRDKQGRKMSKSLGNSPDLLHLIDKYGADAVRFGIMISSPAGNDLLFDDASLEQGRNFCNKLWNALKLLQMWNGRVADGIDGKENFAADWFENRLNQVSGEVDGLLKQFRLSEALKTIYSLIWDDFCSWYLEWIKPAQDQSMPAVVFSKTIEFFTRLVQLLHPFMPFITEEIYHLLAHRGDDLCMKQFGSVHPAEEAILEQGQMLKDVITAIRDARNKHQIKPREPIRLHIQTALQPLYQQIQPILHRQVNTASVEYTLEAVPSAIAVVCGKDTLYLQTDRPLDTAGQKENLLQEIDYLKGFIGSVEKKLGNERFVQNAKPEVVALERRKKADAEMKIKVIEESLAGL